MKVKNEVRTCVGESDHLEEAFPSSQEAWLLLLHCFCLEILKNVLEKKTRKMFN